MRQPEAVFGDLGPFSINQFAADIADMAKAHHGFLRQIGDSPRSPRVTQKGTKHLCGFRLEDGFQAALDGRRLVIDLPLDEHAVESDARIAYQIDETDVELAAKRLRFRRQIGGDEDRRCRGIEAIRRLSKLKESRAHMPWLSDRFDLANQHPLAPIEIQPDDQIDTGIRWCKLDIVDADKGHPLQQRPDSVRRLALKLIHMFWRFQHSLKLAESMKSVKLFH
jgi:hypothetical protein